MDSQLSQNLTQKMQKVVDSLAQDFNKIRTGRAHTGLLDSIRVDYHGTLTPLSQLAGVSVLDARTLLVQPWDKKSVTMIDKAIRESDLGFSPVPQGDNIRIPVPVSTEERRKELVKFAKTEAEQAKVKIRNLRREANELLKKSVKEKTISENEERAGQTITQKLTDQFIATLEKMLTEKEKDIMTIG